MKKLYITAFLSLLICALFSCGGNKNNNPAPAGITGTWNLQKQEVKIYVNGSLQSDSVYSATSDQIASVQFNSDKTYTSYSYLYGMQLGQRTIIASGKTTGTYTYAGAAFSVNNLVTGLNFKVTGVNANDVPTVLITGQTAQVNQLTAHGLEFTTSVTENYTLHGNTSVYLIVSDYVYSR